MTRGQAPSFPRLLIMPFFSLLSIEFERFMIFSGRLPGTYPVFFRGFFRQHEIIKKRKNFCNVFEKKPAIPILEIARLRLRFRLRIVRLRLRKT
jgi:hypothetical protein